MLYHKINEPVLTNEDFRIWKKWKRVCLIHACTDAHKRKVDEARMNIRKMLIRCPNAYVAWSAGKDSTVMMHLTMLEIPNIRAMSIKDDCDYPGEVSYLQELATRWNIKLDIVVPDFSLQKYLADNYFEPGNDIHSRGTDFADKSFYSVIEDYRMMKDNPGVYLGLRKSESHYRLMNYKKRGSIYTKQNGETVCQPICNWHDIDVYAYLFKKGIKLFSVYRCVRLHKQPGDVRKSWWVPGASALYGQVVWLRTYYPSLYQWLRNLMPGVEALS